MHGTLILLRAGDSKRRYKYETFANSSLAFFSSNLQSLISLVVSNRVMAWPQLLVKKVIQNGRITYYNNLGAFYILIFYFFFAISHALCLLRVQTKCNHSGIYILHSIADAFARFILRALVGSLGFRFYSFVNKRSV